MSSRRCRHQGFTLIELLVVISIIALLIGILLPALGAAREASRSVACLSNCRSWGSGSNNYCIDNKTVMAFDGLDMSKGTGTYNPSGPTIGALSTAGNTGSKSDFQRQFNTSSFYLNAIPQYLGAPKYRQMIIDSQTNGAAIPKGGSNNVFICPSLDARSVPTVDYGTNTSAPNTANLLNSDNTSVTVNATFLVSYAMNSKMNSNSGGTAFGQAVAAVKPGIDPDDWNNGVAGVTGTTQIVSGDKCTFIRPEAFPKPSATPLMIEKRASNAELPLLDATGNDGNSAHQNWGIISNNRTHVNWTSFTPRHTMTGNITKCDGSAKAWSYYTVTRTSDAVAGSVAGFWGNKTATTDTYSRDDLIWAPLDPLTATGP